MDDSDCTGTIRAFVRPAAGQPQQQRVPTVQEAANEILRQLKLAQDPAMRNKPLRPQARMYQNP